ncbi:LysM domain/BON superfamily protein [Aquimixticola soesokkakensis]|uniref:LysM domain/BON superfamily protein n=1 Tax=Aquimixticola soesokkakensis TaxID=1519096 RepID=A0A1Y5SJW8_9RHOB|nr:LysM peptidoglycan-binding domain-containing protein [Aquimixticola soesokkakensis]SLN42130.1 LysM domain/BON superfamily protein [Aquimixticola soesokkakensis]
MAKNLMGGVVTGLAAAGVVLVVAGGVSVVLPGLWTGSDPARPLTADAPQGQGALRAPANDTRAPESQTTQSEALGAPAGGTGQPEGMPEGMQAALPEGADADIATAATPRVAPHALAGGSGGGADPQAASRQDSEATSRQDAETTADSDLASAQDPVRETGADVAQQQIMPSFDLVRLDGDGAAVVAGRAASGAQVSVMSQGVEIARTQADAAGNFVALFDLATESAHALTLSVTDASGNTQLSQGVALVEAAAPQEGGGAPNAPLAQGDTAARAQVGPNADPQAHPKPAPTVLLAQGGAVTVLQNATSAAQSASGDQAEGSAAQTAIDAISYDAAGGVVLSGQAPAGSLVRIYLDTVLIGETGVGSDGRWQFSPDDPAAIAAGTYQLRADAIGPDGAVLSRIQTPFKREDIAQLAQLRLQAETQAQTQAALQARTGETVGETAGEPVAETGAEMGAETGATQSGQALARTAAQSESTGVPVAGASLAGLSAQGQRPQTAAQTQSTKAAKPAKNAAVAAQDGLAQDGQDALTAQASGAAGTGLAETGGDVGTAQPQTRAEVITVQPGNTLWGIASASYGDGFAYVRVFRANEGKITDPDLIYPGQVFTVPPR